MTPHKETTKEPIGDIILWPTMQSEWSKNSTFQLTFSVFDYDSALYDPLDVESSIVLEGQEYIVKNCVENFDTNTKNITAWHVYNEISRIYKRSDLTLNNNQDNNASKDQSYGVEDLLKAWIDGNKLGFSYEVHGNFDKQSTSKFDSGSGKEMLSKITELWPSAVIYPDNKKIRVYSEDEFYKDNGRVIDFPRDAKSVKTTRDSQSIINMIRCVGGKHEVQHTVYTGTGGTNANGPTEPVNGDWTPVIQYAASFYGIKPNAQQLNVLRAQIHLESGGNETIPQPGTDPDGDGSGPALGLLQFKRGTFNTYCREPYTNILKGFDQLIAFFNIPNALGQINGVTGWSPHGAPITKDKLIISPPNPWGWPFPDVGEGHFSLGQTFGTHPQDGVGRTNGFHDGLDFGSIDHPGREVHCIHGGTVTIKSAMGGLGNFVVIHTPEGFNIVYQEAFSSPSNIIVNVGQKVKTGDVIGYRDTDHVHIGVTKQDFYQAVRNSFSPAGGWLDPVKLIKEGGDGSKPQEGKKDQTVDNSNAARPKLTITTVNNGRDYIDIPDLQKEFGIIEGTVEFDNVDDPNVLMQQAQTWIKAQRIPQSWEVTALELHMTNFKSFKVADRYMFINPNVAKTQLLRITQKEIDLLKPHASSLTIGDKTMGLTDYQLENQVNFQQFKEMRVMVNQVVQTQEQSANNNNKVMQNFASSADLAQMRQDLRNLQDDNDRARKGMVSLEEFNKLKEQVEKLTTGGDDNGK